MTHSEHCCPVFEPDRWEGKIHQWEEKLFIQDSVVQLFHMPLNMSSVVARMFAKITAASAAPPDKDFLLLAYDPSPWKSELYMTVTKDVPGAVMARLSGTFLTKVYDGPYNHVPRWVSQTEEAVRQMGRKLLKHYFFFAYCPACAKKYGHNYAVDFAQIEVV